MWRKTSLEEQYYNIETDVNSEININNKISKENIVRDVICDVL